MSWIGREAATASKKAVLGTLAVLALSTEGGCGRRNTDDSGSNLNATPEGGSKPKPSLSLTPRGDSGRLTDAGFMDGAVAAGGAGNSDASIGLDGTTDVTDGSLSSSDGAGVASDASVDAGGPVAFAVTLDVDSYNIDIAVDRVSGSTYVAVKPYYTAIDLGDGLVYDLFLVKILPNGTIDWHKVFPTAAAGPAALAVDDNGNIIIASDYGDPVALGLVSDGGVASGAGIFVAKYSSEGLPIFGKMWAVNRPFVNSVAVAPGGRILVGGSLSQSSIDFGNGLIATSDCCGAGFVFSLTTDGTLEWGRGSSNANVKSVAPDAQGNAIVIGWGLGNVDFDGSPHTASGIQADYLIARFSPSGDETDFNFYGTINANEATIAGTADPTGNIYLRGDYDVILIGNPPAPFAFNGGPTLSWNLPYFMSLTAAGDYRYGSSLAGSNENSLADLALTNSYAAWYVGLQRGSLSVGNLLSPDPGGDGALIFRVSPAGAVDALRGYGGGYFMAVDADGDGRPVVGGAFRGGVDFGAGMIPAGNPSVVVAKLNL